MATLSDDCFDPKQQDASRQPTAYSQPVINQQMIGRE